MIEGMRPFQARILLFFRESPLFSQRMQIINPEPASFSFCDPHCVSITRIFFPFPLNHIFLGFFEPVSPAGGHLVFSYLPLCSVHTVGVRREGRAIIVLRRASGGQLPLPVDRSSPLPSVLPTALHPMENLLLSEVSRYPLYVKLRFPLTI